LVTVDFKLNVIWYLTAVHTHAVKESIDGNEIRLIFWRISLDHAAIENKKATDLDQDSSSKSPIMKSWSSDTLEFVYECLFIIDCK